MIAPTLACCNFLPERKQVREFALDHGFAGVDWTISDPAFPLHPAAAREMQRLGPELQPLEVRFHCAFPQTDLGDEDPDRAAAALRLFQTVCRLVAAANGRYLTIHIGLGRDSTRDLGWERTLARLRDLVQFAANVRLRLCLENLSWGWTSRPDLYEKLLRKSGAWATLDIGHAAVCPAVVSQQFRLADFVRPHPERFCNAHVYHLETEAGHLPPQSVDDVRDRLDLVAALPLCHWWVLELREEAAVRTALPILREYLAQRQAHFHPLEEQPPAPPA